MKLPDNNLAANPIRDKSTLLEIVRIINEIDQLTIVDIETQTSIRRELTLLEIEQFKSKIEQLIPGGVATDTQISGKLSLLGFAQITSEIEVLLSDIETDTTWAPSSKLTWLEIICIKNDIDQRFGIPVDGIYVV